MSFLKLRIGGRLYAGFGILLLFCAGLAAFGVRELVQSGQVAIGRGPRSISERTLRPVPVPVAPTAV